jgi:hypothetical protein
VSELPQVTRFFTIDLFDGREILAELLVERAVQSRPHKEQDSGGEHADDEREHARMPQGEARPDARRRELHSRSLRGGTHVINGVEQLSSNGSSIFRRSRRSSRRSRCPAGGARGDVPDLAPQHL